MADKLWETTDGSIRVNGSDEIVLQEDECCCEICECSDLADCMGVTGGFLTRDIEIEITSSGNDCCDDAAATILITDSFAFTTTVNGFGQTICTVGPGATGSFTNYSPVTCIGGGSFYSYVWGIFLNQTVGASNILVAINGPGGKSTYDATLGCLPDELCNGEWIDIPWVNDQGTPLCPGTSLTVRFRVIP